MGRVTLFDLQKNRYDLETNEQKMYEALRLMQQAKAKRDSLADLNEFHILRVN